MGALKRDPPAIAFRVGCDEIGHERMPFSAIILTISAMPTKSSVLRESYSRNGIEMEVGGYCPFDVQPTNSLHQHNYYEVCLVLSGRGEYLHGGRRYALVPRQVFLAEPGIMHEITSFTTQDLRVFFISFSLFRTGGAQPGGLEDEILESFLRAHRIVAAAGPELQDYLALVGTEGSSAEPRAKARQSAMKWLLFEMLQALSTSSVRPEDRPLTMEDDVQRAIMLMDASPEAPIKVRELALQLGISERTLRRKFRSAIGRTVLQEMNDRRMRQAAHRLLMGFTVSEVALSMGMRDPAQFTRAFTRSLGLSPKRFQSTYMPGGLVRRTAP